MVIPLHELSLFLSEAREVMFMVWLSSRYCGCKWAQTEQFLLYGAHVGQGDVALEMSTLAP